MKERYLSKTPFLTFVYISKCNINLPGYFGNSKKRFLWTGLISTQESDGEWRDQLCSKGSQFLCETAATEGGASITQAPTTLGATIGMLAALVEKATCWNLSHVYVYHIAHIWYSHNRYIWQWCTFFWAGVLFSIMNAKLLPILAHFDQFRPFCR